jgi:glycosyltransferase involved in cell wall biosynthesis
MVMGEALACGCPVVATANTGAEDLLEDGREGFIVPIRRPEAVECALETLARDSSLRATMSAYALQRVRQIGGWEAYGRTMANALQALLTEC